MIQMTSWKQPATYDFGATGQDKSQACECSVGVVLKEKHCHDTHF